MRIVAGRVFKAAYRGDLEKTSQEKDWLAVFFVSHKLYPFSHNSIVRSPAKLSLVIVGYV